MDHGPEPSATSRRVGGDHMVSSVVIADDGHALDLARRAADEEWYFRPSLRIAECEFCACRHWWCGEVHDSAPADEIRRPPPQAERVVGEISVGSSSSIHMRNILTITTPTPVLCEWR